VVAQLTVLDKLRAIVGDKHAYPPDQSHEFAVDGLAPQAIVEPGTYGDVAAIMRYASEAGLAVIPLGGGTKKHIGNLPSRYDIALSLSRLNQMIEHEPADLTVTCQAGMMVGDLQQGLGIHGQRVPLDVWLGEQASVGGVLAANTNGPSRAAYGALRDFTIGMRVITADGRVTRAGGKVVKNVAGYDLCKLYIGSLGTLGIIVEATLKVMPVARHERSVVLSIDTPGDACAVTTELYRRGLALSHVQLSNAGANPGVGWRLQIGLAGSEGAVERSQNELTSLVPLLNGQPAGAVGMSSEGFSSENFDDRSLLCRFSALPSRLAGLIGEVHRLESPEIVAEPATGILRAAWSDSDGAMVVRRACEIAARHLAVCVVERCSPELKKRIDVFGDPPPAFELMRRIKQQFDPMGTLSPGRFVGRL
jgi:glycolate oxidase FAD binding subunit